MRLAPRESKPMNSTSVMPQSPETQVEAALAKTEDEVYQALCYATLLQRKGLQALSEDERRHARRWATIAVRLMNQATARGVSDGLDAVMSAILTEAAAQVREFDEDASFSYATGQAVDRFVRIVTNLNPPFQFARVIDQIVGVGR